MQKDKARGEMERGQASSTKFDFTKYVNEAKVKDDKEIKKDDPVRVCCREWGGSSFGIQPAQASGRSEAVGTC